MKELTTVSEYSAGAGVDRGCVGRGVCGVGADVDGRVTGFVGTGADAGLVALSLQAVAPSTRARPAAVAAGRRRAMAQRVGFVRSSTSTRQHCTGVRAW
jgi:hypothetical protein